MELGVDLEKHILGRPCPCQHFYPGTDLSLRFIRKNGTPAKCVECVKEYRRRHYQENREVVIARSKARQKRPEVREYIRQYMREQREQGRESRSTHGLPYRFLTDNGFLPGHAKRVAPLYAQGLSINEIRIELIKQEMDAIKEDGQRSEAARLNRKSAPERRHERIRQKLKALIDQGPGEYQDSADWSARIEVLLNAEQFTDTQEQWIRDQSLERKRYNREKSKGRKAKMRGNYGCSVPRSAIEKRFTQFGEKCAYCGCGGDMQIEHVNPIARGGWHVLSNIVPACKQCNHSKRDHLVEGWYRSQSFFCEKRWAKILRVTGMGKESPGQLLLL